MTLEQISYLSQTIAAVAVIASLVFVGVQIRQSEKTQRSLMHDNRLRQIRETMLHIASPGVTESFVKGSRADADITYAEWTQYLLVSMVQDITRDEQYRQFREGLIGEDRWRHTQTTITASMTLPGYRAIYQINRLLLSAEYQALLDGLLKETVPLDSDMRMAAWKSLAETERARIGGAQQT
jgi:hypothetical protein